MSPFRDTGSVQRKLDKHSRLYNLYARAPEVMEKNRCGSVDVYYITGVK